MFPLSITDGTCRFLTSSQAIVKGRKRSPKHPTAISCNEATGACPGHSFRSVGLACLTACQNMQSPHKVDSMLVCQEWLHQFL
ncbi:rCG61126 [Rattus norvegicus]|uniref:RCG61126 n=1 Tax=Rattus norvegicus TaxID=10116 RepID=A6KDY7_RAT|nr:rCG61126 [Rattus norvegicus]